MGLGALEDLPDFLYNIRQEIEIALFRRDYLLPVPLVHIGAVIVIKKVILANGLHVSAQALANPHTELLERYPLPLGCGLHDLGIDRVLE